MRLSLWCLLDLLRYIIPNCARQIYIHTLAHRLRYRFLYCLFHFGLGINFLSQSHFPPFPRSHHFVFLLSFQILTIVPVLPVPGSTTLYRPKWHSYPFLVHFGKGYLPTGSKEQANLTNSPSVNLQLNFHRFTIPPQHSVRTLFFTRLVTPLSPIELQRKWSLCINLRHFFQ